ncbi:MAG: hypothetical protein ABEK59_04835, partial [Halobacteria archaeon]
MRMDIGGNTARALVISCLAVSVLLIAAPSVFPVSGFVTDVSEQVDRPQQKNGEYITDVKGNNTAVTFDTQTQIIVEVRDQYNNPVSGVELRPGTPVYGRILPPKEKVTGTDGRASFIYENSGPNKAFNRSRVT